MTTTGYTTLEHLKRSLNNGELPVMTPVSEIAKRLIDPAFVLGQGGLQEDAKRGLRCPARGCGRHFHNLGAHWRQAHGKTICPVPVLRAALSLRPTNPLMSSANLARVAERDHGPAQQRVGRLAPPRLSAADIEKRDTNRRATSASMESRNLRNSCDAQMRKRYDDCRVRVRRPPTAQDLGGSFMGTVARYYGTLNAFRATIGVSEVAPLTKRSPSEDDVVAALEAWYKAHKRLPLRADVAAIDRTPYLPGYETILRALSIQSWPVAMSHVAWLLGIDDPNYSPKKREAA